MTASQIAAGVGIEGGKAEEPDGSEETGEVQHGEAPERTVFAGFLLPMPVRDRWGRRTSGIVIS